MGWLKREWIDRYTYCTRQEARLSIIESMEGAAIEGKPEKQTFVDYQPYLAYSDRVASLYLQIENLQKAREYIARASKYAYNKGVFETLADQIETLQQQIKNK